MTTQHVKQVKEKLRFKIQITKALLVGKKRHNIELRKTLRNLRIKLDTLELLG